MTAARGRRKDASIKTLWAIAKSPELGLSDEDLHAVIYRETGKESLRSLTQGELNAAARVLQNMKDSAKIRGGAYVPRTAAQLGKIHALEKALGWDGDPQRVQAFARRMTGVDRLEWLTPEQCGKVIEGLKAMVARRTAGKAERA